MFFIKDEPVFSKDSRGLPKNFPDSWVFDSFILADRPFAKALWILESFVLVTKHVCGKLVSSLESPTTFDEIFKVTLVHCLLQIIIY